MEGRCRVVLFSVVWGVALDANLLAIDILTFNTGLMPMIDGYENRTTRVWEAIKELDADIVCLQEVWYSDDLTSILNTNDQYTYSVSDIHINEPPKIPENSAPCLNDLPKFQTFFQCYQDNCAMFTSDDQVIGCILALCDLIQLDQQCASCIVYSGVHHLEDKCLNSEFGTSINEPGLLLMSKLPLKGVQVKRFDESASSLLLVRSYILAEIEDVGRVACTHMTADINYPYIEDLPYVSWKAQHLAEANNLTSALASDSRAIIAGDLNTSPGLPSFDIKAEIEESYELFESEGYRTTHELTLNHCTYCEENAYADNRGNNILDHVLVKNVLSFSAKVVFDEYAADPLSDHYGVVVKVHKRPG